MLRHENMSPFIVMDIVREAARFSDTVHFEIGQPDLAPPPGVRQAMIDAVADNRFLYTESLGLPVLRERICRYYADTYQVDITPDRVLLTPGTSGAFLIAYGLTLGNGDVLGLTDPSYPCYRNFAAFLNARTHTFPVDAAEQYQLHPDQLRDAPIQALQISSPANPTGNVYTPQRLRELVQTAQERGIAFISDELYHGLVYGEAAATALQFDDNAYVINGFSKYFCMPGARLGWIIVPKEQVRAAEIIAQNLFICAPTVSQYGALGAFDSDYLTWVRSEFQRRRDFLCDGLGSLFDIAVKPQGAFYLWADISRYSRDSLDFARTMLEKTHVAATPGVDFGSNGTQHFLRFAYTRDIRHMKEGIERIGNWLSENRPA